MPLLRSSALALVLAAAAALVVAQPERQPQRGSSQRAEQWAEQQLAQRDADGDGKISRDEALERFVEGGAFDAADADADGFLTTDELTAFLMERTGGRVPGPRPQPQPTEMDSFHDQMENAGRAVRALRRTDFDDASREADLRAIQSLQAALVGAKAQIDTVEMSPQAVERYGDDLSTYRRDFRVSLIEAIEAALDLEKAVLAGEPEPAKEAYEALRGVQGRSHDLFQADD